MDNRKWFALVDGQVKGPFDKQDLENRLSAWHNPLIWGRGQSEWVPPQKWEILLQQTEVLIKQAESEQIRLWRIRDVDHELKPMTQDQMLNYLKTKTDLSNILIWTEGYNEWKEIYQIHKIMDELGVSRRKHPRVPIMGTLACEGPNNEFSARLLSISEGGLGITETPKIKIGEKYKLILKSPNLTIPIHATGEIVYIGNDGYAGLRFIGIQTESKSLIIEYIKKFFESKGS